MSAAWFVRKSDDERPQIYDTFEEALHEFLKAIWEDGAEAIKLEWSS